VSGELVSLITVVTVKHERKLL